MDSFSTSRLNAARLSREDLPDLVHLHLDGEVAPLAPAGDPVRVGVVEDTAGHDRADVQGGPGLGGECGGRGDEGPGGGRGVGVAAGVDEGRGVVRGGREREDRVGQLHPRLERPAGPHPDDPRRPQLDELLEDDGGTRAAHAGRLHRERATAEGAGEPEEAALLVHAPGTRVEEALGDGAGPARIPRAQDSGGVVTGLGP